MAVKQKSTAPSGLKITRSGLKFVTEWNQPSEGYEAQEHGHNLSYGFVDNYYKDLKGGIGKNAKKKTVDLDNEDGYGYGQFMTYYPYTYNVLSHFSFRVRGRSPT